MEIEFSMFLSLSVPNTTKKEGIIERIVKEEEDKRRVDYHPFS